MEQQNKKPITLGSLFDGSGGFPLGGVLAGITPIWSSEIEPFPIRVTTARFPNMKHYGDISTIDGSELEPVDIISFGSPCQNLSVAGKREGLDGNRSSLFYEAIRIVKEMREATNGKYPRYIVWENVPGAFSSNKGEDFKAVLTEICKVKDEQVSISKPAKWENAGRIMGEGFSIAWRLLDAQYWGVPQRRQRIYLVADFDGGSAGKILFESEGLSGYSAESFRSWQRAAGGFTPCVGEAGFDGYNGSLTDDTSATLGVNCCTEHSAKSRTIGYEEECSPTLRAGVVPAAVALENHPADSRAKLSEDGNVQTLTSRMGTGGGNVPMVIEQKPVYCLQGNGIDRADTAGCNGKGWKEDVGYTLNTVDRPAVAYAKETQIRYIVRRLTPTECARLQGFPDEWGHPDHKEDFSDEEYRFWLDVRDTYAAVNGKTQKDYTKAQMLTWYNKLHTDSSEYKMWGNGIALPCALYVMHGIADAIRQR